MAMIDIIYLAASRPEFTQASLRALADNTNWDLVSRLIVYTDGALISGMDGRVYPPYPIPWEKLYYDQGSHGGPVNVMLHYLSGAMFGQPTEIFAKIDNDVIVPPGWLDSCAPVMRSRPELSFLGIEPPASRTKAPWARNAISAPEIDGNAVKNNVQGYAVCDAIGGIGLMRTAAFRGRAPMVQHSTYGGFTDWQQRHQDLVKGWIVPPLKLFLLDRLPLEPWASLSKQYITHGHQRPWSNYPASAAADLWEWWLK